LNGLSTATDNEHDSWIYDVFSHSQAGDYSWADV